LADIRANTNLRIALRVTDVTESADAIDAPDAVRIASRPGENTPPRNGLKDLDPNFLTITLALT
jgi:S-DNA-T family DNA segregation ATPase FtsK/SpoIIIE